MQLLAQRCQTAEPGGVLRVDEATAASAFEVDQLLAHAAEVDADHVRGGGELAVFGDEQEPFDAYSTGGDYAGMTRWQEGSVLAFGLDDALLGWLVASAGGALLSRLRGDRARKAMRQLVDRAVAETVTEVASHLDSRQALRLRRVLQEHDAQLNRTAVSSLPDLRVALRKWIAGLDKLDSGEPGYLAALGVDADRLGETLTERIAAGIREHGRSGGPLVPVADWLWRDEMSSGLDEIKLDLQQLRHFVEKPGSYRGGLPGGTRDFTGRQQVLDEVAELVQGHDPAGNVVEIHAVDGMAGVGKTELALRAAHQHKHRYPDRQYFINLHGYTRAIPPMPPEAAMEELLRQAGVPGAEIPPDLAGRQVRWQALMATQRSLIVLDNALDADQVRPLLPNAAGCLVLITSRTRLRDLPGVRTWPLEALAPADAIELFTRIANTDRDLDREAIARVVDIVGGLPVAVRAVASQVDDDYTESELVDDLVTAKSCAELVEAAGPLGAAVCAAFDTSLQRLDQAHQRAFSVLGVHPGPVIGVPQFAAIAALPTAHARQVLRLLANRNLITPVHDRVGHRRYQLHDLLREFARQQAESRMPVEERSAAVARLTSWYAAVLSAVERLWDAGTAQATGSDVEGVTLTDAGEARAWLAGEQDNLLALAGLATKTDAATVCNQYAQRFYDLDHYATARALHKSAADICQQTGNQDGQADALRGLGEVALATGDHQAESHFRDALAIFQQTGNPGGKAHALNGLGDVARFAGDYPVAGGHFRDALVIHRQTGDTAGEARALRGLGDVAKSTGEYLAAGERFREARAICHQIGDGAGEAYSLAGLGEVAQHAGDHRTASKHFHDALTIFKQTRNRAGEAYALRGLGMVAQHAGDHRSASKHFHDALSICRQTDDLHGEAYTLNDLGSIALAIGDHPAARASYHDALAICQQTGDLIGEAHARNGLGDEALHTDSGAALVEYRAALAICQQTGYRAGEAQSLTGIARAAKAAGLTRQARERWRQALTIYIEIGSPRADSARQALEQLGSD